MMPVRKSYLIPKKYDEVSLVDIGAASDADILIMKRGISKDIMGVGDLHVDVPISLAVPADKKRKKKRKINGEWVIVKAQSSSQQKSSSGKSSSKSSSSKQSSQGNTQRAQNWNSSRHPRAAVGSAAPNSGGTFTKTSSASKNEFGNNGTTLVSQMADAKAAGLANIASQPGKGGGKKSGGKGGGAAKKAAGAAKATQNKKIAAAKTAQRNSITAQRNKVTAARNAQNAKTTASNNASRTASNLSSAQNRLASAKINLKFAVGPRQTAIATLNLSIAQKAVDALTIKKRAPIAAHKSFAAILLNNWMEGKVTP